jgi:hypothetical protein
VEINGKMGYIDDSDRFVIQPIFDGAAAFYEGLAAVRIGDKRGFINTLGEVVIKPQWDYTTDFSEGLAAVEVGGQWGYIDKSGSFVIGSRQSERRPLRPDVCAKRTHSVLCKYLKTYTQGRFL